jgi:hypothetical protein
LVGLAKLREQQGGGCGEVGVKEMGLGMKGEVERMRTGGV